MDEFYMQRALELAGKGEGWTNPNPMVGAVIVKDGRIISEGYHEKYGEYHAERNAIINCAESMEGATIYVTLEPCCHYGKTPPCTEAIIESGIKKVVIGALDPNPKVAGGGVRVLKEHNIEVVTGVLEKECLELNHVFFHYIQTKMPYVIMKYAMTLDGKIATYTGESKWITGEAAREHVQYTRHHYAGIMVGIQTVLTDDPMLSCRIPNGRNPVRIICDSKLQIPIESNIVSTAKDITTYIATASNDSIKKSELEKLGCKVLSIPIKEEHIDLFYLMEVIGQEGIDSVLLEGGATLNYSALSEGIVNRVQAYIAPKIFGGASAKSPVAGRGVEFPKDCINLELIRQEQFEQDLLLEYRVKRGE